MKSAVVSFCVCLALLCQHGQSTMCSAGIWLSCGRPKVLGGNSKAASASCEHGCTQEQEDKVKCPSDFAKDPTTKDCLGLGTDYVCNMPATSMHKLDAFCLANGAGSHTLLFTQVATHIAVRNALSAAGLQASARAPGYGKQYQVDQDAFPMVPQNNIYYQFPGAQAVGQYPVYPGDAGVASGSNSMLMIAVIVMVAGLICLIAAGFVSLGCYWFGKKSGVEATQNRYHMISMKAGLDEQI